MDFPRYCRITLQFCMLLSRPPWLYIVWQERKVFLFFLRRCKKIGVLRGHVAQRIATCLSRACPQKIPPWIFWGIGDLQANLRVAKPPLHGLFNANQERGKESHLQTVRFFQERESTKEGKIWTWPVGRRKKARSGELPQKNPSMDFFVDCRIATQFCMLLSRHPWLDIVWQERKAFLVFLHRCKKNWGS